MRTRKPAVAGTFYPADSQDSRDLIEVFLDKVKLPKTRGEIKALIVPHAGLVYSGQTAAYGYETLRGVNHAGPAARQPHCHPQRGPRQWGTPPRVTPFSPICERKTYGAKSFILLGPSHRVAFAGVVQDTHDWWETPLGRVEICDLRFEKEKDFITKNSRPHMMEHCLEVQLSFLQTIFEKFMITPLLTGVGVDYEKLAKRLEICDRDRETILIVSSDLSHYYPQEVAERIDKKTIQAILDLDIKTLETQECEACGKDGILAVVILAKKLDWQPRLLHYETSGVVTGDFSQVVGYGSIGFYEK